MRKNPNDVLFQVLSIEYLTGIPLDLAYYCGAWRVVDTNGNEIISAGTIPEMYKQLSAVLTFLSILHIKL